MRMVLLAEDAVSDLGFIFLGFLFPFLTVSTDYNNNGVFCF